MNNFRYKKVLITGATGILGSWMTKSLLENNISIQGIAIDKSKNDLLDSMNLIDKFKLNYIDIAETDNLSSYFENNNFDIVFHLAAQTQVIEANINPIKTFESNIQGTWNVLNECNNKGIPVVVASSDKAYGESVNLPYKENFPLNGIYPYEVSKSITDLLSRTYKLTYGTKVTTLRCGNIYGGGDLNWDRLIPGLCKWLLNDETPILRTDGNFKRDWVYVEDVVNAYLLVGNALYSNDVEISLSYNFASDSYKSVIEIYNAISMKIKNKIITPKFVIDSEKEIKDQYLDSTKIFNELNIKSLFSFDSGIDKTIDWYKDYFLK